MAKEETGGVWRTIGGRRVFIKDGQSLADAMKESGKFNSSKKEDKPVNNAKEAADKYMSENYEKKKKEMENWLEKSKEIKGEDDTFKKATNNNEKDKEQKPKSEFYKNLGEKEKEVYDDFLSRGYSEKDIEDTLTFGDEIKRNEEIEPVDERLKNNMIVSHYGDYVAIRDKNNNLMVTQREQYNDFVNGKKDRLGGEFVTNDDDALKSMISYEALDKYPYEGYVKDQKTGNDKKYNDFVDSEYNKLKDRVIDTTNAKEERAKTNENYRDTKVPEQYKKGEAPFESKRVAEEDIKEKGYQYFSTHGVGPGTHPKDVKVRETDDELPGGWTTFKTDRPLTQKELDYYDIQPETRNAEFRRRFGLDDTNKSKDREILIKHDLNDNDPSFKRQMLGRMESDNKYYLGNGGRNERHLWAHDVDEQIDIMKALYNTLPEKERPDWLTMKDIENYEKQMKSSGDNYDGTREYLKKNTTMTNAEINEYIRNLKNKK